jgi:hypothetical protein
MILPSNIRNGSGLSDVLERSLVEILGRLFETRFVLSFLCPYRFMLRVTRLVTTFSSRTAIYCAILRLYSITL